jgi:hypothetical protein
VVPSRSSPSRPPLTASVAPAGSQVASSYSTTAAQVLLSRAFVGCWLVRALSFVAIGLSGAIAYVFGRWFGIAFVCRASRPYPRAGRAGWRCLQRSGCGTVMLRVSRVVV